MIARIIQHLVPGAEFALVGNPNNADEYADALTWHDARPQPSWADIQAAQSNVEKALQNKAAEEARATAYRSEADPLFFGWQRGENTEQEWLDKVAEIRARHPYA